MIITRNLSFFDKNGHNLNLEKTQQQTITVTDDTGSGAELDLVIDSNGMLVQFVILNGGTSYTNPEIKVEDLNTGNIYTLKSPTFITLNSGVIESITLDSTPGNFSYPSVIYEGTMFFDEVSVNLIENQHIFIAEKLYNETTETYFYSHPRKTVTGSPDTSVLNCSFENENDEEIYLFGIDYTGGTYPKIEKSQDIDYTLQEGETTYTTDYIRISEEKVKKSLQINLGLSSDEEAVFERTLYISEKIDDTLYTFAKILLRGETEEEDERFKVLLENFGIHINDQEEKIFRDSEISEVLPNYILLNQKRKEMLLENHNIYPYIGSYKALVNILNYFDYFDLGLKEYWLNIDENSENYGKYKHIEIPLQLTERGQNIDTSLLLPKTSFKKTSYFGLFFDINQVDGTYDEYGIPNVEDTFLFTIEEILIKLFGLKKYLKDKFLPLNARIIDITGEGIYFERFAIKAWKDDVQRIDVEYRREVDFVVSPEYLYIVDVNDYNDASLQGEAFGTPGIGTPNLNDRYLGNFLVSANYPDQPGIDVGCPLTLDLDAFNITWDEMQVKWDDLNTTTDPINFSLFSWNTIGQGEFYEIDWFIEYEEPKKFSYNRRGRIEDLRQEYVILPYAGSYEVKVVAYDMNNFKIQKRKTINVNMPNVEFISFARFTELAQTWDDLQVPWDDVASEWVRPAINHDVTWDDMDITWESLNMNTYFNQDSPFAEDQPKIINRIFEKDRKEGTIKTIVSNVVVLNGQLNLPEIQIGEYLFFKKGQVTKYFKVTGTDYSQSAYSIITFESFTDDVDTSWTCYREIRGIVIDGDYLYNEQTNSSGLQTGDWVSLEPSNSDFETVKLTDVVISGGKIIGVQYDSPISKYPGEYAMIYRNFEESILSADIDITNKILTVSTSAAEKLIKGFSIIELTYNLFSGDTYSQRLLVEEITSYPTYAELSVKEIDSDLSYKYTYINTAGIAFKYDAFQTRLVFDESGTSTSFNLDFNFYPYPADFIIGSPLGLNGDWYLDYRNKSYSTAFEVTNVGNIGDDTFISINDINKLLYLCSPSYNLYWKKFNETYALNRFGTKNLTWENFNEVTWDDIDSHLWEQFDYHAETLCNYIIREVAPNGKIRFNERDEFIFNDLPSIGSPISRRDQMLAAVEELNSSESPSVVGFSFYLIEESSTSTGTPGTPGTPGSPSPENTLYIFAVAKNPGAENLGYLVFDNGVEGEWVDASLSHTYPIGNFKNWREPYLYGQHNYNINWNPVPQTYYLVGLDPIGDAGWYPQEDLPIIYDSIENFWESYRLLYDRAITGSFTWNEIYVSDKFMNVPLMTTIFFKDDNCKIAGKTERLWKVIDKTTNKILIESDKPFLIWTFSYPGEFNIELQITDSNGNKNSIIKTGYVSTLNYE